MDLTEFGFDDRWGALMAPYAAAGLVPARVVRQHRERSIVIAAAGELTGEVAGRFRRDSAGRSDYPVVGDWVAAEIAGDRLAVIHAVLPRRSAFTRKVAGNLTEAQVVAANIDTVFLVTGLDGNFSLRRIERYLTSAWDSGASPVIVLNKADLCGDPAEVLAGVEAVALGAPVVALSALDGSNVEALRPYLVPGRTAALLGSSGVGKSTLINRLLGEERLPTREISDRAGRGRHTTTHRELVQLPDGALLIDTPGMRELQLWADEDSLERAFDDIEALAARCRFADCRHEAEPGCAVRAAVDAGSLDPARLESYFKQRRELAFLGLKMDERSRRQADKSRGRRFAQMRKEIKQRKPNFDK
ncbi:MAG TPA: ribosome small subunit-dependent GTPase A [candidate division Zixibacteria bacterium]|nr:ribosome small subunit-dependent GTPase A [candidate division Zixibacteria bacterium]MDD4916973.1 ribosome small subunit-dependent GTPase A [candidate division Zixibacteria bacterium]MDM7974167.1 ribosome small subunit-dependent GTPase A [candidate division Zixibacteria bacterium]HOD67593.1 ribosome small subunit-dependent GTPase A [candidate division Zixibacteria bacterium]HOZ06779.1 ribosome small subunit-dependent GTPase A [candidate division Zixibacteria bacterium]